MRKAFEDFLATQKILESEYGLDKKSKILFDYIRTYEKSFEEALIEFPECYEEILNLSNMRFVTLQNHISDEKCCLLIPYHIASKLKTFVHCIGSKKITLVTLEPFNTKNIQLLQELIKNKYPSCEIEFALTSLKDFYVSLENLKIQEQIYHQIHNNHQEDGIYNLYILILKTAISQKASDIHLESKADYGSFKIRQDGKIKEIARIDFEFFELLCNKIKLESKLDISEKRLPQDGRYTLLISGVNYDFRVSCMPTQYGESIVMRILDRRTDTISLDKLNLTSNNLELIEKILQVPYGIILIAGPTGSGKSTTLYAMLEALKSNDKKLITIEDPIEYQINLATQIQINPDYGFGFSEALRAILRQDPDIIMVGEIRDQETLQLAMQASLTGHLVLSTIHTNDSVSTIDRLINMGVEPYLLSSSLVGVISQRLARKLCPKCKKSSKQILDIPSKNIKLSEEFFFANGCQDCNMQGFLGREAVMEVLEITPKLREMIAKNHLEFYSYLKNSDFKTLFDDGVSKAMKGVISLEEIYRLAKM
ncbi:hypothetical protein BKH42_00985 [Helicobacter sp. 13S00482-2]|uniref:GspE/PulE family protein n=1 Tax=Helicobacter sp. 13S00482-2 TaxID=1476200 RepID=UPI000BA536CA|nr:GspE/PulE family protein [Helicobacter sp. 13S00482-2]PAF54514.1 hypothetical protein BKH42_00985 [Helicobacter sp. 13S00482-2]